RERFLRLTRGAAVLFPNLDEGRVLTGAREPEAVARELLRFYPRVVLTLGAQGCLWAAEEGLGFVPAPAVEPVDTTGAGDAFAAGFLHAFCRGEGLAASARMGSATAGRCICVRGARPAGDGTP
ncbi:MAG TPA: sugar kinase, partial [Firmicutes bacterium]|nr:sugar kinase [Bacillota bacterium]